MRGLLDRQQARNTLLRTLVLLAGVLGGWNSGAIAQTYFTLTNGHYYWFDGNAGDTLANGRANPSLQYLTGFDKDYSWAPIHQRGTHAAFNSTEIVEQGDYYLALDTQHVAIVCQLVTANNNSNFDPLCVWQRDANIGHYFQEWNGYRYYIYATHATGVSIYKVAVGEEMRKETKWNDWDHGLAIEEAVWQDGQKKASYFWLIFDTLNDATGGPADELKWRLSTVSCYQRPEEMIYGNYRHPAGSSTNTWDTMYYYDNVRVGGMNNYPAGVTATFMPVEVKEYPMAISNMTTGMGLASVVNDNNTITYGGSIVATANIHTSQSDIVASFITEAYTEYIEETYRYGINLSSRNRTDNTFNSAGIPTANHWYYYNNSQHTEPPESWQSMAEIESVRFELDSRAKRFLTLGATSHNPEDVSDIMVSGIDCFEDTYGLANGEPFHDDNGTPDDPTDDMWSDDGVNICFYNSYSAHNHPYHVTVNCYDIPTHPVKVILTAYVYYDNGTMEEMNDTITVLPADLSESHVAKSGPVIKGNLHGGGKMANVSGNTSVIVHNTDYTYAVYGGNDIAGWVQGDHGATLQVGTRYTDEDHPVKIGWLYGGGCGYYRYGGVYSYDAETRQGTWGDTATIVRGVNDHQYVFHGGVYDWNDPTKVVVDTGTFAYEPLINEGNENGDNYPEAEGKLGGTIPYVKTARVTIGVREETGHNTAGGENAHEHNDYILIDSIFGGGENAFVGTTATGSESYSIAVDLNINGGTILAAFGGNNYGGAIAPTSLVNMNINCTKLTDDEHSVSNTFFHGAGRDFGIRHVYGGGNKVESTHASVTFNGGMVDTAYIGGNAASVKNPIGTIECQRDGIVYDAHGYSPADGDKYSGKPMMNGHFIYTNPTLDTVHMAATQPDYIPDTGLYNVHFLFGGNNKADMANVSFVRLHSGGVGAVLGGGNEGSMINDKGLMAALADHHGYIDISPLLSTLNSVLSRSVLITPPTKIGAMIAADQNSKIIAEYVHGGCRKANVKNSCGVYLAGGSYYDVFAGNDVSGDVGTETDGATYAVVTGDAVVHHNVYGGCDGYYHCDDGTGHYMDNKMSMNQFNPEFDYDPFGEMVGLMLPTVQHTNVFVNGGIVKGNVVAGGVMANVGYVNRNDRTPMIKYAGEDERPMSAGKNMGTVRLEISDTAEIHGNVFGGGAFASIYGLSRILVRKTPVILGGLFAGNDALGQVQSFLPYQGVVDYSGCANAHDSLLAESLNQAAQLSSNGDSLNYYTTDIDGIKQYNPRYSTYVLIEDSAVINSVYGSGNGAWDYDGTRPQFPSTYVCPGEEGNVPDQASTFIDIHTSGGFIDTVFGGGNGCTVSGEVFVLLNITDTVNTAYPDSIGTGILSGFAGGTTRSELITATTNPNYVGTIFGGNNFNDMNTVPQIHLVKGNVKNVYGGGNAGNMTGLTKMEDICGNKVENVSTHVLAESDEITVTDSVFGGCRMSNIDGMAYVEVRETAPRGIQYLFGGNDVSGNVKGNARIDMSSGTVNRIWGGSNGRYDYVPMASGLYDVYDFGTIDNHPTWFDGTTVLSHADSATKKAARITTAGRPDVDSTHVNLWGGNINASVFTGGAMADCRATCLIVDDHIEGKAGCPVNAFDDNITINGAIYGGGEGRWDDLNARDNFGNRWGNVNGSTHVHLYHAEDVSSATAYGGGGGGDVHNTFIKTYDTWENPFYAVFGGNWGSEVYSTAHLEFNGTDLTKYLFGGNDFTGNVYRSEIVVNSGRFFNIFGGGNGDYPDSYYTSQFNYSELMCPECLYGYMGASPNAYKDNKRIEHPNTEYVHIVFNDGEVDSCLYGGGKMGTVLPYKKDPTTREYIYNPVDTNSDGTNDLNRFIPDTMRVAASSQYDATHTELTFADPEDFSYTVVNIHGGLFHRNIFAGGRGYKANKKPLVYGVKVLNMDGGEVYESVYGGSEFVNDGYPAECKAPAGDNPTRQQRLAVTTMRPSSIVNLTGGTVGSNLYGTGYQGIVHGSSYVNIGLDAIDSCTVWSNTYGAGAADSTYKMFKPGYAGGHSDALTTNVVTLKSSVYSGANWGNASGAVTFDNPGFVGGESRIYVDGKGYNTTNDYITTDPEMNLLRSLYGSGTSVLGGDIHSHIEVRNYGGMLSCHPTRTFETIQRTDSLWLHNTAITFLGATDANQQYMSNRYSLKNIDYWNYRGYNVSELEAAVSDVAHLGFFEQGSTATVHRGEKFDTIEVEVQDINVDIDRAACGDNVEICQKEYMVSPTDEDLRHTLLILDNGIDLKIAKGSDYGSVTGFGFVTTPGGYLSTITARPKMELSDSHNMNDGGFVTTCDTNNRYRTPATSASQVNTAWSSQTASFNEYDELKYTNHASANAYGYTGTTKYREWKVGDKQGLRETEATLLAHTNPASLPNDDKSLIITAGTTSGHYGIAEAVFEMPATTAGHYYKLMDEGFILTGSNGNFELVDSAWYPLMTAGGGQSQNVDMNNALKNIGNWYSSGHRDPDTYGDWANIPNGNPAEMDGTVNIHKKPEYTFGLIMIPNTNFATVGTNSPTNETGWYSESGNYFDYLGYGDAPEFTYSNGSTTVTLYDGMNAPDVFDLTSVKAFIVKVCDPYVDDDEGTFWYQANLGGDNYASTLSSYDMSLESGDAGYDATLHSYFAALNYSCGAYSYETYGNYSQDHWSYTYDMPLEDPNDATSEYGQDYARFIVNGNARVNSLNHYCSPKVYNDAQNPNLKPSMHLYLTYDTSFSNTFNGNVKFKMMEYDENGNEVAPIQVTVYIQTIIDELKDREQDVLAMYNGGRTNTFTRKLELVPTGEERNLYITGIRWMPTDHDGGDTTAAATSSNFGQTDRFSLLGDSSLVWATSADYPAVPDGGHPSNKNHNSHNRFALTIIPTNNVSEDAIMANGWIRGVGNRTNVYNLANPNGDGSTSTPVKTVQWDGTGDSVAVVPLNSNSSRGYFVGTLDGRGSAMLDLELTFDGTRIYDKIAGKGYVGKVILTMETFSDEDDVSRGTFDVTIYVKTREHGDTIYIASANSVTRTVAPGQNVTVYPYSDDIHHPDGSYDKSQIGKYPSLYVQSFGKALDDGIYEEGDVLCIIDTVKINNDPVHIAGPNGPPIEVIRYDGHHHDLPDEQSVYRGPMVMVSNGSSFTAQNIAFHGGAGADIKHIKRSGGAGDYDGSHAAALDGDGNLQFWNYTFGTAPDTKTVDKLPDTNIAYAPIIIVTGEGSTLNLREGTIVEHNWNGYGSVNLTDETAGDQVDDETGMPILARNMGAISVTDNAILVLNGDVTVENNYGHTMTGFDDVTAITAPNVRSVTQAPGGAAIYIDGGTMELSASNRSTAVTITNNYLMNPAIHDPGTSISWWDTIYVNNVPEHYRLKTEVIDTWHPANVLLTRTAPTTGDDYYKIMNDTQSDVIVVSGTVGDNTKIGVRKWFPGEHERDTIRFAIVTGSNNIVLNNAVNQNHNFQSDDKLRVFYNQAVNLTTAYLFRCASFRHQYRVADNGYVGPVYYYVDNNTPAGSLQLRSGDVLHFGERHNYCPTGGDSIIYRVQGGLMPYTFTWTDTENDVTIQKTVTPYTNALVRYDLENTDNHIATEDYEARYAKYAASIADTLLLPLDDVSPLQGAAKWNHIHVTATDATGECTLYKDIDLRILMDHDITDDKMVTYWPKATDASDISSHIDNDTPWQSDTVGTGWTDTARTVPAIASHNYKGVHITPRVWVNRSEGTIRATVPEANNDYVYQWYVDDNGDTIHELTDLNLCPGDTIFLYTEPRTYTSSKFIMWDFDPYYHQMARYIVPARDAVVTAYYGPASGDYWYQYINTTAKAGAVYDDHFNYAERPTVDGYTSTDGTGNKAGFVNTYNGDIHIYDENGLAWFISRVNGLNGQQGRSFHFNRVLIHKKHDGEPYDMQAHLWTPVGTEQHPFMGRFFGVSDNELDDMPYQLTPRLDGNGMPVHDSHGNIVYDTSDWDDPVVIKNIIVNEPQMYSTGLFGFIDSAGICNIAINGALIRGSQYVGGLAGISSNSYVKNSSVESRVEDAVNDWPTDSIPTTILTTHYVSGGMLGKSEKDTITRSSIAAKFVGDAVYSGGGIGYGTGSVIQNVTGWNFNRQQGLYLGGLAGYLDGTSPVNPSGLARLFGARKSGEVPSMVQNNYFRVTTEGNSQRLGGVVGYAENTIIENNYIYGDLNAAHVGGVTAVAGDGTATDHNYYQEGSATSDTYRTEGTTSMGVTATFEGEGDHVIISRETYGTNNLTHALNRWVRDHNNNGASFLTWRNAHEGENHGYPVFGLPSSIIVSGNDTVEGCGEVVYDGVTYFSNTTITLDVDDPDELTDSTVTLHIIIHNNVRTMLTDSAIVTEGYQGYGFTVTPVESMLLMSTIHAEGSARLVLTDTLQTEYGCDSIVMLMLIFTGRPVEIEDIEIDVADINVYPNPTVDEVNIECKGMSRVEIYDNEGRRLEDYKVDGDIFRLSLARYSSGMYYLRVHTPRGVTIQKVVKK